MSLGESFTRAEQQWMHQHRVRQTEHGGRWVTCSACAGRRYVIVEASRYGAAQHRKCPACAGRGVATLDHQMYRR